MADKRKWLCNTEDMTTSEATTSQIEVPRPGDSQVQCHRCGDRGIWHLNGKCSLCEGCAGWEHPDDNRVNRLAALIREVDGKHNLGAAALAEALVTRGVTL